MIITENTFRKFTNNLITEEIHLPHGTKSVKLITHVDVDGLISAISMIKQLEKQGIDKNRVSIEFAQYGDEKKDKAFNDRFRADKKNQFVAVTDFAKLPKGNPFEAFNSIMNFKGSKIELSTFIKSRDWTKVDYEEFANIFNTKFKPTVNKFTEASLKKLYECCLGFSFLKSIGREPVINATNIADVEFQLVTPDFLSDHHSNENGSLSAGLSGDLAAKSPSEAELIASKYAPGLWSKEDIDAVSMVDSAGYTEDELVNTVFLEKHFTGKNKKRNLATIICTVYDNMVKKDKEAAKWVIKNSDTNLVSVYDKCIKAAKYNKIRREYLDAIANGNVKEAEEMLKDFPKDLNKAYTRHGEPELDKPVLTRDEWVKKNKEDLADAKTGYKTEKDEKTLEDIKGKRDKVSSQVRNAINSKKGKLAQAYNFTLFNGNDSKTQYTRYMSSLYSVKGQRTPFTIRYWSGFFQVAKNTLYKGNVDFSVIQEHVLEDIKNFLLEKGIGKFKVDSIIKNMKKENGGHSTGIWSFQGFDNIKPTSKEYGSYWDDKNMIKRADEVHAKIQNTRDRFENISNTVVKKYSDLKKECIQKAITSVINWTNKLYPPTKAELDALKTSDDRFEGK